MKLSELIEAKVTYTKQPTKRFRVAEKISFDKLKNNEKLKKYLGPNTVIFDVTDNDVIKAAPGENKWNAMTRLFGRDEDEITCAFTGHEWLCLAINVNL